MFESELEFYDIILAVGVEKSLVRRFKKPLELLNSSQFKHLRIRKKIGLKPNEISEFHKSSVQSYFFSR